MENDSNSQKEKHDFKDVETAKKILNEWGYSLDGSIFKGSIYHVRGRRSDCGDAVKVRLLGFLFFRFMGREITQRASSCKG